MRYKGYSPEYIRVCIALIKKSSKNKAELVGTLLIKKMNDNEGGG